VGIMNSEKKENRGALEKETELSMGALQVLATILSLLAGLMFSASILFFSFARQLPYADIFTLLILTDGMLFIFCILTVNYMLENILSGFLEGAERWSRVMNRFANSGIGLMMLILLGMALYLRWELGVVMFVLEVLCFGYIVYNRKKQATEIKKTKAQVVTTE